MYFHLCRCMKSLKCDHSNESHSAVLSCVTACCDVVLNVWIESTSVFIQMKATVVYCGLYEGALTVDETLVKCHHSKLRFFFFVLKSGYKF